VAVPTAKEIHEAAETAIYALIVDGKSQAGFQGRYYTANNLGQLREISAYYRELAIERGEITTDRGPVMVSYADCRASEDL
jgi:hypothetical protein